MEIVQAMGMLHVILKENVFYIRTIFFHFFLFFRPFLSFLCFFFCWLLGVYFPLGARRTLYRVLGKPACGLDSKELDSLYFLFGVCCVDIKNPTASLLLQPACTGWAVGPGGEGL